MKKKNLFDAIIIGRFKMKFSEKLNEIAVSMTNRELHMFKYGTWAMRQIAQDGRRQPIRESIQEFARHCDFGVIAKKDFNWLVKQMEEDSDEVF